MTSDPWDLSASVDWIKATASISGLEYTLPIGNQLEIKMIVPSASEASTIMITLAGAV